MPVDWTAVAGEATKLGAQFVGALIIARLAVKWALERFKTEKSWERQRAALSDAISSLREMKRIVDIHTNYYLARREISDTYSKSLGEKNAAALAKFQTIVGTARIEFPASLAVVLEKLETDLANSQEQEDYFLRLDEEGAILKQGIEAVVRVAKKTLH